MQKKHTKEEIEAHSEGKYDNDGFFILPDKAFFDTEGFYFDKDGYDDLGGYYCPTTGNYIPPPYEYLDETGMSDYDDYYDELWGGADEEQEISNKGEDKENNNNPEENDEAAIGEEVDDYS